MSKRCSVAALGVACASVPSPEVKAPLEASRTPSPEAPEPVAAHAEGHSAWPDPSQLILVKTDEGALEVRAFDASGLTAFRQRIASDVQEVLNNPELGLFWFSDAERLWVIDLRVADTGLSEPVLIASHLPSLAKLRVRRGASAFEGPGQVGEDSVELQLNWDERPYLSGGEDAPRIDDLDGRAWLARERSRPARAQRAWSEFDPEAPHAPLPAARARCQATEMCGAALPFGDRGWQLVVAGDEFGDFEHHFCLLYDPAQRAFATPPEAPSWGAATALESGACGPYFFNARNDAFFASNVICRLGGSCATLDAAWPVGWVAPGVGVGAE